MIDVELFKDRSSRSAVEFESRSEGKERESFARFREGNLWQSHHSRYQAAERVLDASPTPNRMKGFINVIRETDIRKLPSLATPPTLLRPPAFPCSILSGEYPQLSVINLPPHRVPISFSPFRQLLQSQFEPLRLGIIDYRELEVLGIDSLQRNMSKVAHTVDQAIEGAVLETPQNGAICEFEIIR